MTSNATSHVPSHTAPCVALITCSHLPKPDLDEPLLLAALEDLGIDHEVVSWDADVDWSTFDLAVLRTPWDYTDRLDEFLDWVRATRGVVELLNGPDVVSWNHHKRYLFDLEAAGVPIVPTRMVARDAPFAFQRAALRRFDGEVVIKPAVGIGAFGAARHEVGTEEAYAHLEALCLLGDTLIQPLIPSVLDQGEVSVVMLGGGVAHAVRKVPAAGDFRVHDHHGGTVLDHFPTKQECVVALAAVEAAYQETGGPIAYARVDLVDFAGPTVMEIELIEPELFLRRDPDSAVTLAHSIDDAITFGVR